MEREKPEGFIGWTFYILGFFITPFIENIRYFILTANRKEWWGTLGRMFLLALGFAIIGGGLGVGNTAMLIVAGISLIPIILVSIRRMHDTGRRGWWILIPFVNFVMCGFFTGKTDGNPYL